MKRKPMFHKLDAIYALKKIPSTTKDEPTYYGLVKRGKKFVEVEILDKWIESLFENEFIKLFKKRNQNNMWCTMGKGATEVTVIPKRSYDYDLFLEAPINRYVDPNIDTSPKALVRKIKITCFFIDDIEMKFRCDNREYAILCPNCTDEEFPTLISHEYEGVSEECLKDDIGYEFVNECTKKCYEFYYNELENNEETPKEFIDKKDKCRQNKEGDIILDKVSNYYFDCSHLDIKLNLLHPQVSKIKYNPATDEFEGMSLIPKETGNLVEKFTLPKSWVVDNYSEELVSAIKNKAIKLANGRYLSVPVGDVMDPEVIDSMVFEDNAPDNVYLQGSKDRCAFCSIASAMYLMGFKKEASALMEYMEKFYEKEFNDDFWRIMQHIVHYMEIEKKIFKLFLSRYNKKK